MDDITHIVEIFSITNSWSLQAKNAKTETSFVNGLSRWWILELVWFNINSFTEAYTIIDSTEKQSLINSVIIQS